MKWSIVRARVLLVVAVVLTSLVSIPSASAQDLDFEPDFFQSEISDIDIELTRSDFEISGANVQSYPGGEGETIQIRGDGAFAQVALYDDSDTNLETMELYNSQFEEEVDEFEVLDMVEDGEVVWTFALASLDGQDLLYFLSVTEDVDGNVDLLEGLYATEPLFFDSVIEAQDTISISGDPFLAAVDVDELEEIYAGGGSDSRSNDDDEDDSRTRSRDADDDSRSRDRDDDEDDSRTRDRDDEDNTRSRDRDQDDDNSRSRDRDQDDEDDSRSRDRDDDDGDRRSRDRDEDQDADDRSSRGRNSGGEEYTFEVVAAEMTVSDDVEIVNTSVDAPGMEQVQFQSAGTEGIALVQVVRSRASAESTLDLILENLAGLSESTENVGTGADATSAWSLDATVSGGEEALILVYVETERFPDYHYVEVIISPESDFLDDLDTFNLAVEFEGDGMFSGLDFDEIEELVDGGGSLNRQSDEPDDDTGSTRGRRTDAKIESGEDPGTTRERSREQDAGTSELDLESQGLVSESEFESLQYGYSVEWDDSVWGVDKEWELTANSDTQNGIDHVILFWLEGNASMMIQVMPADNAEPADFVDMWESEDYIVDMVHEDAEILVSDSGRYSAAVVYLTYSNDGEELILIQEVIDIDGGDTVALITMFGAPEEVADAYADAEDLVTVDGLDLVSTFTPREISRAIGS